MSTNTSSVALECTVCHAQFFGKLKFMKHCATHRTPSFTCNICNKGFYEQTDLDSHYLTHTDVINTYNCQKCERKFVQKHKLEQHMQFHKLQLHKTNSRPEIKCDSEKSNLKIQVSGSDNESSGNENDSDDESQTTSDDEGNFFRITQTRSGRNVKLKKFYDSADDISPTRQSKNPSCSVIRSPNMAENDDPKLVKNVSDMPVKDSPKSQFDEASICKKMKIVSTKIPESVFKECIEKGYVDINNSPELSESIKLFENLKSKGNGNRESGRAKPHENVKSPENKKRCENIKPPENENPSEIGKQPKNVKLPEMGRPSMSIKPSVSIKPLESVIPPESNIPKRGRPRKIRPLEDQNMLNKNSNIGSSLSDQNNNVRKMPLNDVSQNVKGTQSTNKIPMIANPSSLKHSKTLFPQSSATEVNKQTLLSTANPPLQNQVSKGDVYKGNKNNAVSTIELNSTKTVVPVGMNQKTPVSNSVQKLISNNACMDQQVIYIGPEQSIEQIKAHVEQIRSIVYEKSVQGTEDVTSCNGDTSININGKSLLNGNVPTEKTKNAVQNVSVANKELNASSGTSSFNPTSLLSGFANPVKTIQIVQVTVPKSDSQPKDLLPYGMNDSCIGKQNPGVLFSTVSEDNSLLVKVTPELMREIQKKTLDGQNLLSNKFEAPFQKANAKTVLPVTSATLVKVTENTIANNVNSKVVSSIDSNTTSNSVKGNYPGQTVGQNKISSLSGNNSAFHPNFVVGKTSTLSSKEEFSVKIKDYYSLCDSRNEVSQKMVTDSPVQYNLRELLKSLSKQGVNIVGKEKIVMKLIAKFEEKERRKREKYKLKKELKYMEKRIIHSQKQFDSIGSEQDQLSKKLPSMQEREADKSSSVEEFEILETDSLQELVDGIVNKSQKLDHFSQRINKNLTGGVKSFSLLMDPTKRTFLSNKTDTQLAYMRNKTPAKVTLDHFSRRMSKNQTDGVKSFSLLVDPTKVQHTFSSNKTDTQPTCMRNKTPPKVTCKSEFQKPRTFSNDPFVDTSIVTNETFTINCPCVKSASLSANSRVHESTCPLEATKCKNTKPPPNLKSDLNGHSKTGPEILKRSVKSLSLQECLSKFAKDSDVCDKSFNSHRIDIDSFKEAIGKHSSQETLKPAIRSIETVTEKTADSKQLVLKPKSKQELVQEIIDIDKRIKKSLRVSKLDIEACLEAMNQLDGLSITSTIWKECLIILKTIKICRKFTKSEAVRQKANDLYQKFRKYYIITPPSQYT